MIPNKFKLIITSGVLIVAFQNCGQPGKLAMIQPSGAAAGTQEQGPLVSDVVNEIHNNPPATTSGSEPAVTNNQPNTQTPTNTTNTSTSNTEPIYTTMPVAMNGSETNTASGNNNNCGPNGMNNSQHMNGSSEVEAVMDEYACGKPNEKKVLVCHIPPGNFAARHTICISRNALDAHVDHGDDNEDHQDYLGACK